jgi:tRNA(Ile)-lysidine synthase
MTHFAEKGLEAQVLINWPAAGWRDSHVVLAVSGGADSVALLRGMLAVKQRAGGPGRLVVGHLNHGLRGALADADQAWLEQLCATLDVELVVGEADFAAKRSKQGDGWEAAARDARYDFLRRTAEQIGARFIAVGHTADDQVETVLHRIVRGTGLAGLAGMPTFRPLSPSVTLVRPLLSVRREEVLDYLAALGQDFRTDETNADPRFTRNRVRNKLLPLVRGEFNAEVDTALLRLSSQADEAQQWIAEAAAPFVEHCATFDADRQIRIDCPRLAEQPPLVIREMCKAAWAQAGWPQQAMGFAEWQLLAEMVLATADIRATNLPAGIHAERQSSDLVLSKKPVLS